jgi:hypothetical protein
MPPDPNSKRSKERATVAAKLDLPKVFIPELNAAPPGESTILRNIVRGAEEGLNDPKLDEDFKEELRARKAKAQARLKALGEGAA